MSGLAKMLFGQMSEMAWGDFDTPPPYAAIKRADYVVPFKRDDADVLALLELAAQGGRPTEYTARDLAERLSYELYAATGCIPDLHDDERLRMLKKDRPAARPCYVFAKAFTQGLEEAAMRATTLRVQAAAMLKATPAQHGGPKATV
ncbi:MAG: hypothetical protein KGQ41_09435 [Alphaproteobacteria bacterium]|nr:hypothetical protein [Alphaproteobacteria bacterium]